MNIYEQQSRWKLYLAIMGLIIVGISVWHTNYLARRLAVIEQSAAEIYAMAQKDLSEIDTESEGDCAGACDYTLHSFILQKNSTIPAIIVNETNGIDYHINLDSNRVNDAYVEQELQRYIDAGNEPILSAFGTRIYFGESAILRQLRYFPYIQFLLIGAFIFFGYLGFNAARRSEQNRVWVGMAKETAHQLGTPITAIVGWLEHLKNMREDDEEVMEITHELRNDVLRLELVADRFSKIGATPELEVVNLYEELDQCRAYMAKRAPRRVTFDFPAPTAGNASVAVNSHLFDWVIENLLRNALDAMEGKGEISARIYEEGKFISADITDTGKGIPASKFKTVFRPGYSTKTRGWGLGLSLAKRIVEEYHGGQIFVKQSEEGKGTTFTIRLPRVADPAATDRATTAMATA